MGFTLGLLAVLSGLYWLGTVWRRGLKVQSGLQLAIDVVLVTGLAAITGDARVRWRWCTCWWRSPVDCRAAGSAASPRRRPRAWRSIS